MKKVVLSVASIIAGIAIAAPLEFTMEGSLAQDQTSPIAKQILEYRSYTPTRLPSALANPDVSLLGAAAYCDSNKHFSIQAPKGWNIDSSAENVDVEFDDPTPHQFAVEAVSANKMTGYSLRQYAAGGMQALAKASGTDIHLEVISQRDTVLDGQPAYAIEFTYVYELNGEDHPLHGISMYAIKNDMGYNVLMATQEAIWNKHKELLMTSASTFHFPPTP